MKKLLSIMILALAITIGLQFADESKANAEGRVRGIWSYLDTSGRGGYSKGSEDYFIDKRGVKRYISDIVKYHPIDDNKVNNFREYAFLNNSDLYLTCKDSISAVIIWRYNGRYYYVDREAHLNSSGYIVTDNYIYPLNPSNSYYDIIRSYFARKERIDREWEKEKRIIAEAEQEKINKFNALISEGDRYYNAKDYENARKSYQAARQINSKKIDEYCNELIKNGDNLYNQKLLDSAEDYYRKAEIMGKDVKEKRAEIQKIKRSQSEQQYLSLLNEGHKFLKEKQYTKAQESFNKALSIMEYLDKDISYICSDLGKRYEEMGEYDTAVEYYKKNKWYGYSDVIHLYRKIKKYDKLIEYYKNKDVINQLRKHNKYDDFQLGDIYIEAKKYNELIEYYNHNSTINRYINGNKYYNYEKRKIYFQLGYAHRELKDYENAINEFNQSIKFSKKGHTSYDLADEVIYYNLGLTYECIGNNKKAIGAYKKALEINPKYKEASEALSKLSTKTK